MLRSEINELEKFIGSLIDNEQSPDKSGSPDRLTEQAKCAKAITVKLKEKWVTQLFSSAKDHVMTRYIQFHQAGVTELSDRLWTRTAALALNQEGNSKIIDLYHIVAEELEQLLSFVKRSFYRFFDFNFKVSAYNCVKQCELISSFETELRDYKNPDVEGSLLVAIADSVAEFLNQATQSGVSYRQIDQMLKLLRMTYQMLSAMPNVATEVVLQMLYRQNFNTPVFQHWVIEYLSGKMNGLNTSEAKEEFIKLEIKRLSAIYVEPKSAFEPDLGNIDELVLSWLQLQVPQSTTAVPAKIVKGNGNGSMQLNLSVPQFAVFIRVFYKNGCFATTNIAKITRFFVQHFYTKKQANISYKSFRRAFYSHDQVAAAMVQDYLQKMLNDVNKTYFP